MPTDPGGRALFRISSPVDTCRIGAAFRQVDRAVGREGRPAWRRLAEALSEPVHRFAALAALAERVSACEPEAVRTIDGMLTRLVAAESGSPELAAQTDKNQPAGSGELGTPLIDASALTAFAGSVVTVGLESGIDTALDAPVALVPLVSVTRLLEAFVQAVERDGPVGGMRFLSGGGPSMPGMQGLIDALNDRGFTIPDISMPGLEFPDLDLPDLDVPDIDLGLPDWLEDFWDRPRHYGEEWEPLAWWWKIPVPHAMPPSYVELIRCTRTVKRLIAARAALAPPVPPSATAAPLGLTWADPITSLAQEGACAGSVLRIRGSGLASIRGVAVVIVPTTTGCHPVSMPRWWWTDSEIRLVLPDNVASGPVGFADKAYVAAYDAWHADQQMRLDEIRGYSCAASMTLAQTAPFAACAPNLGRNYLRAGAAIVDGFSADNRSRLVVKPGDSFTLSWSTRNSSAVQLTRDSMAGPDFPGGGHIGGPNGSVTMGPFTESSFYDAVYRLVATGPCSVTKTDVTVALRRPPNLAILAVELTQAVQTTGTEPRVPLVADKATIVRVTVTHDSYPFHTYVRIRGQLQVSGGAVPQIKPVDAKPPGWASRRRTEDTLTFRIPPGLSHGAATASISVWTEVEYEQAPGDVFRRSMVQTAVPVVWHARRALKLRYVRVSTPKAPAPTDAQCREVIQRAHDLLPIAALDVAPARMPTWHTSHDPTTKDGKSALLAHLDDQHDCTTSEAIFPWEDDCPDDDGAIWIGLVNVNAGGLAQGHRWFNTSRNTIVSSMNRGTLAHELGHTQKFNHVNANLGCPKLPPGAYDSLPLGGMISPGDAVDPFAAEVILGGNGLWDVMTYACDRWISPSNWKRFFDKMA